MTETAQKQSAQYDFSGGIRLVPVTVEQAGHMKSSFGVMLRYKEPQSILEAQFHAAVAPYHDEFPHEIVRAADNGFYKFSEIHDLTSLQRLIQQGHPQTKDLASAYQHLAQKVHGPLAKAELSLA